MLQATNFFNYDDIEAKIKGNWCQYNTSEVDTLKRIANQLAVSNLIALQSLRIRDFGFIGYDDPFKKATKPYPETTISEISRENPF